MTRPLQSQEPSLCVRQYASMAAGSASTNSMPARYRGPLPAGISNFAHATDPLNRAMEEVDARPQEVVEVRFEAGVLQRGDQGVENVGDGDGDGSRLGQGSRVWFVMERAMAAELEFGKEMRGRGCGVRWFEAGLVVEGGHRVCPSVGSAAPIAAFARRRQAAGGAVRHPQRSAGPKRKRRMA